MDDTFKCVLKIPIKKTTDTIDLQLLKQWSDEIRNYYDENKFYGTIKQNKTNTYKPYRI